MKDFSKATPKPWWASGESSSNGAYKIEDADGWHVAWIKEKKDVHLIVTAVNNFENMKEAIESMLVSLNTCGSGIPWNCDTNIEYAYQKCKSVLESIK